MYEATKDKVLQDLETQSKVQAQLTTQIKEGMYVHMNICVCMFVCQVHQTTMQMQYRHIHWEDQNWGMYVYIHTGMYVKHSSRTWRDYANAICIKCIHAHVWIKCTQTYTYAYVHVYTYVGHHARGARKALEIQRTFPHKISRSNSSDSDWVWTHGEQHKKQSKYTYLYMPTAILIIIEGRKTASNCS